MKNIFSAHNRGDVLIGLFAVACLLLSTNLFHGFMPSSLVMILIGLFVATFALFAVLVWRENPQDEREAHMLLSADRLGFLAGAVVLMVALVIASVRHESTNVPVIALITMILTKLIGKYLTR